LSAAVRGDAKPRQGWCRRREWHRGFLNHNQSTGEPTLIQNIDGRGIKLRTFALDASGRMLVATSQMALPVRDGTIVRCSPPDYRITESTRMTNSTSYASTMSMLAPGANSGAAWSRYRSIVRRRTSKKAGSMLGRGDAFANNALGGDRISPP
jgi:hypothetical protein